MRVLIVGLDSFTGFYLREAFAAAGAEVFGSTAFADKVSADCDYADLGDKNTLVALLKRRRPQVIINLAAQSFVAHNDISSFYATNVVGPCNLLQAILDSKMQTPDIVIQPSSANIYGEQGGLIDENTAPQPVNHYAASKWAMEMMLRQWMNALPIVIVRPFNYTGVGQNPSFVIAKLVHHFQRRAEKIELGNLDVARDFSDVRDVARAYLRLAQCAPAGEVFNICSGVSISLQTVISYLQQATQYQPQIVVNPAFVRANEIKDLRGSSVRLDQAVGSWRQIPVFSDTLDWMLKAHHAK